jgi:glycosyltransferase involved in cell wall biosynthesis
MFYGGCENVISNLLSSDGLTNDYRVTFAYRDSTEYREGFNRAVPIQDTFETKPIKLPVFDTWIYFARVRKKNRVLIRLIILADHVLRLSGIAPLWISLKLFYLIYTTKPDIIHLNNGGYPSALSVRIAAVVARTLKVSPVIMTVNNLASPQWGPVSRVFDFFVGRSTSRFVTASKAAANTLISRRRISPKKVLSIPNACVTPNLNLSLRKELGIPEGTFIFAAAGLLTKRKGFDVLLRATAIVSEKHKDFVVLIFGSGEELDNLINLQASLQISSCVKFLGYEPEFTQKLKDIDILVTPSIANEDMPYVLVEAAAAGKACIGTNLAGIPEVVNHGVTGLIVDPGNVEQLAEAMSKVLIEPSFIAACAASARGKYLQDHSIQECVKSYKNTYAVALRSASR